MTSFLKTFGLGILYFILLPFLLIYLVLMGIYLFFKNIIYIFLYKNKSYKEELSKKEDKAFKILKGNHYANSNSYFKDNASKQNEIVSKEEKKESDGKIIYQTTNIYISDPSKIKDINKYFDNGNKMIENNNPNNDEIPYIEVNNDEDEEDYIDEDNIDKEEETNLIEEKHSSYNGLSSLKRVNNERADDEDDDIR